MPCAETADLGRTVRFATLWASLAARLAIGRERGDVEPARQRILRVRLGCPVLAVLGACGGGGGGAAAARWPVRWAKTAVCEHEPERRRIT